MSRYGKRPLAGIQTRQKQEEIAVQLFERGARSFEEIAQRVGLEAREVEAAIARHIKSKRGGA
jgi:predicted HTH domain antitoxin